MLSDTEKEAIRREAHAILTQFGATLERVRTPDSAERETSEVRTPGKGLACDTDFRTRMFANAPEATKDSIVAEKAGW